MAAAAEQVGDDGAVRTVRGGGEIEAGVAGGIAVVVIPGQFFARVVLDSQDQVDRRREGGGAGRQVDPLALARGEAETVFLAVALQPARDRDGRGERSGRLFRGGVRLGEFHAVAEFDAKGAHGAVRRNRQDLVGRRRCAGVDFARADRLAVPAEE